MLESWSAGGPAPRRCPLDSFGEDDRLDETQFFPDSSRVRIQILLEAVGTGMRPRQGRDVALPAGGFPDPPDPIASP